MGPLHGVASATDNLRSATLSNSSSSWAPRWAPGILLGIVRAAVSMFLLAVLACITVLIVLPTASHGAALTVLTGSMTPKIPVGSVVLVRPVDPRTLEVGDVATYQSEPGEEEFITHRIVDIDTSTDPVSFTFKGDANKGPDLDPVPAGAIRGEVWFHVPYLGAARDALHGKAGLSLLAMILLGGYAAAQVSGALKDRRRSRSAVVAASESDDVEQLSCDRPLLVATFRTADVGSAPCVVARAWGAMVLAEDDEYFSVLLARRSDDGVDTGHLLEAFHPISVRTIDSTAMVTVSPTIAHPPHGVPSVGDEIDPATAGPTPSREHEHALA